eukprot:1186702-Prorocentrum_minimum.AAC.3
MKDYNIRLVAPSVPPGGGVRGHGPEGYAVPRERVRGELQPHALPAPGGLEEPLPHPAAPRIRPPAPGEIHQGAHQIYANET